MTAEARVLRLARIAGLAFLAMAAIVLTRQFTSPGRIDFVSFWAAAKLAVAGDPVSAWNMQSHAAAQGPYAPVSGVMPFAYPPPFLLLILPLGALPYTGALTLWLMSGLPAFLAAARGLFARRAELWLALAFPPVLINMVIGQAAFVTAGLFVGGLVLAERRPFTAGLLLGGLVIKPHLALLLPLATLAGGRWRIIMGAACSSVALLLLALLAFGTESYRAFFESLPFFARGAAEGLAGWHKFASFYAFMRSIGSPAWLAWAAHGALGLLAASATLWAWRREHPARAAILAAAAAMIPPYIYTYDQLILLVPFVWLLRQGFEGRLSTPYWPALALISTLPLAQLAVPLALAGLMAPALLLMVLVASFARPAPDLSNPATT